LRRNGTNQPRDSLAFGVDDSGEEQCAAMPDFLC
jgi:hypothetical protein